MLFDIYLVLGMQKGTSRYPTVPGKTAGREQQIPFDDASWNLATVLTRMKGQFDIEWHHRICIYMYVNISHAIRPPALFHLKPKRSVCG
jgi:hypothetical protein